MTTVRIHKRLALLLLILCLLPFPGIAAGGGAADADAAPYDSALLMLSNSNKMDKARLEDVRVQLEQAGGYQKGYEYLTFVQALLLLHSTEADRFDNALDNIRRLAANKDFSADYYSQKDSSGRQSLPDLEKLAWYIQARKLEYGGDKAGAIALYDAYPVLDAVARAGGLSSEIRREKYDKATGLLADGTLLSFQQAAGLFEELKDYRDSPQRLRECLEKLEALATLAPVITIAPTLSPEPIVQPPASFSVSVSSGTVTLRWTPVSGAERYRVFRAVSANGAYQAIASVTGTEYSDIAVTAGKTYYYKITSVRGTLNSIYTTSAAAVMPEPTPKPTPTPVPLVKGEVVEFGRYEQDNNRGNGPEPIRWRVLKVEDNKALLLSDYNLDCMPYHDQHSAITWATCTLRSWLNNEFLWAAFTQEEQELILMTELESDKNHQFHTDGGVSTKDYVFLLNTTELFELVYITELKENAALNTKYAKARGVTDYNGYGDWWLRTPGETRFSVTIVIGEGGSIFTPGSSVEDKNIAVRPALWVDLSSGIF